MAVCVRGVVLVFVGGHNPFRVGIAPARFPRVARRSQPWALLRNPFGILRLPPCLSGVLAHDGGAVKKRRRLFLIVIGVGVLAGVLAVVFRPAPEPEYGGMRLSEWVDSISGAADRPGRSKERKEAVEAILQIGTNAIPFLVNSIGYEEPAWKTKLYATVNNLIRHAHPSWYLRDKRLARQRVAEFLLAAFGQGAKPAIPELTRLLNDPKASASATRAAAVLANIGNAGLPPLLGRLTNHVANPILRMALVNHIGYFGTNARTAFPIIQRFVADPDVYVRIAATNALRNIDPKALEKATAQ